MDEGFRILKLLLPLPVLILYEKKEVKFVEDMYDDDEEVAAMVLLALPCLV